MVEIAKAISYDSSLIIMDEPTSAITEREVAHLFKHHPHAQGQRRRHHLHHPQDG
jgi:ABC-type sugar transport system ATPase subunit